MKLVLKILLGLVLLLVVIVAGAYAYLEATWNKDYADSPRPAISAVRDSAVIARGEYLATAVAHCAICHQSLTDMSRRSGIELGTDFAGGHIWDIPMFGRFVAANLTPDEETGIGKLSDGDLARIVRSGVGRDGKIVPFMSFAVGPMADEDLVAVVSYLRTLKPVKKAAPPEKPGLFCKLVVKGLAPKTEPPPQLVREGGISLERGRYLANGPAACFSCHSEADPMHGFVITGPRFQGSGQPEPDGVDPAFEMVVPNLTPDPETGHITNWDEDTFVGRFKKGVVYKGTKMPWESYARMTEDDIRSIYRYIRSLEPVKHDVGPIRRPAGWKPPQKA